jgi:transcription elongation factor GreA
MARWDDLHRAIEAKDSEGAERIWLELIESDPEAIDRFLTASRAMAAQQGGKREAGILLWMLAESLKEKGKDRVLVRVLGQLARTGPDDGSIRTGLIEACRRAYPERADLEGLLEKSGVLHGPTPELATQADALEGYLQLEPGGYVFHKSGWGVGRVVQYLPEVGRCVIDFRNKPGHQMDIDTAAKVLERLPANDIRAMAMADPKGLRSMAHDRPLEVLRQVLARFKGSAQLRHLKDTLVPDAVAPSTWSEWWKSARKAALLDPRFQVGTGRDPRIEYQATARVDFRAQVEKTLKASATPLARQQAVKDLLSTIGQEPEARQVLGEAARSEMERTADVGLRLAWQLLLAEIEGRDPVAGLKTFLAASTEPGHLIRRIADEPFRALAARALLEARPDGADLVLLLALEDDPVIAEAADEGFGRVGKPDHLQRLLKKVDEAPLTYPNLFAWYVKGLRRNRWSDRTASPYSLAERVIKTLDAVEYRARRAGSVSDRRAVGALEGLLSERSCALVQEAADATDSGGARHLLKLLEKNLGLKGRLLQRLQDTLIHAHPTALKDELTGETAAEVEAATRSLQVYMSPDGIARLRAEYERIVNQELPANSAEIARAREFGDLRENAEYHAAREKHALLTARADAMRADLTRAVAITRAIVRTDAVSVGTRVRLKDASGERRTYVLLGPPDADVDKGVISYLTPLGQALMGSKPGEHVRVEIGDALHELEVLEVECAVD